MELQVKAEFARLDVRFTLFPVYDDGPRPYLRAVGEGHFAHLDLPCWFGVTYTRHIEPEINTEAAVGAACSISA